jgi:lipoprotein-anchoring transpeptidase ErfK/SrfK
MKRSFEIALGLALMLEGLFLLASGQLVSIKKVSDINQTALRVIPVNAQTKSPDPTSTDKRIEVNLTTQRLYAYEGNKLIMDTPISSGKWNPTPTGTFHIWIKLRYAHMVGGNKSIGTYYDLANVPYTMYFYNDQIAKTEGYSLHGTYWHHNFGHPMSHGCVNMITSEAEKLYGWADVGTPVIIYGQAPTS